MGSGFIRAGQAATHGLLPFFVSGGMRDEKIEAYIKEGAIICAGGFDLICSEKIQGEMNTKTLAVAIMEKCIAVQNARKKYQQ
jgi:2-keto-3-deoxy-6-phosphogluconate aldolase